MTSIETSSARNGAGRTRTVRRTASAALTVPAIRAMKAPQVRADGAVPPGAGRLKIRKRKTPRGAVVTEWLFMWVGRGDDAGGTRLKTITLGTFSERQSNPEAGQFSIEGARAKAKELQQQVRAGVDPALAREQRRHIESTSQADEVRQIRELGSRTLSALMHLYVDHLESQGKKKSAYDVRNMFRNHVELAYPELAQLPAAHVTPENITQVIARLVQPKAGKAPKGRTALKLRSYLAAAFKLALGASRDPMIPAAVADFGLTINPAAAVDSRSMAKKFNRADSRVLTPAELRFYMIRLEGIPSMLNRLVLQLQLNTGGQRVQQLLNIEADDIKDSTFVLLDPKGRRAQARRHVLPLLPQFAEMLGQLATLSALAGAPGSIFAGRGGKSVKSETLSGEVTRISVEMVEAGEAEQTFRLGDIRRTCETMMAETLRLSKDTRAQLLSHGISGVQDVHYDKGEHLEAKTAALDAWIRYLEAVRSGAMQAHGNKVIPIRKKAA
jgi:integrase